ncbi:MAG: hypothetical protein IEMM0002_0068 [bacterium]|nr:MAG: hypothetical protein IEMM0002_0068 [bacterium]
MDFRINLSIPVRYMIAARNEDEGKYSLTDFFRGLGGKFSGGGAAFYAAKEIPVGSLLYVEMFFPFDKNPICTVSEVLRIKSGVLKGKKVFLCVTRFVLIGPKEQDRMVAYMIGDGARAQKKT